MKILILFILSLSAFAQNHELEIGIGSTCLSGDYMSETSNKISPDFYYTYKPEKNHHLKLNIHQYDKKDIKINSLNMNMQYSSKYIYTFGGLGLYQIKDIKQIESKIKPGLSLGVGTALQFNKLTLGFIAHYNNPFDRAFQSNPPIRGRYTRTMMTLGWRF